MIIELFGPPGVGKTTLAQALADGLSERGRGPRLALSYRPSERPLVSRAGRSTRLRTPAALCRLARPMVESFAAIGHFAGSREVHATTELMRLLTPRNLAWSLRLHQYMGRLSRNWRSARLEADIVLFDQGFVQAVYTLALLSQAPDRARIGLALDTVPAADLLIRLDAPLQVLEARLAERRHRQGRIERLFDLDVRTNLASVWIFDEICELLRASNWPIICASSIDRSSVADCVENVCELVVRSQGKALAWPREERHGIG